MQQSYAGKVLIAAVERALAAGDDRQIALASVEAGSASVRNTLHRATEIALEPPRDMALAVRLFAMPLVVIAGGLDSGTIPGVIPDVVALRKLFETHGALGPSQNFGLGNALVTAGSLAAFAPSMLYRISRGAEQPDFPQLDLAPGDIKLSCADEQAHLRFLVGALVAPRDAPGFTETAGNIGAWGMPLTRELAEQLGQEGMSLLPIPRPPMSFRRALQAGQFALHEVGFQLFLSSNLRKSRSRSGEPDVSVAAFADGSIRVRLDSRLDETFRAEFAWPLDPDDDLAAVSDSILRLLAECRLDFVEVADTIQPVSASH
jgi:hypothetical protein